MNIEVTKIVDVDFENFDRSKVFLADEVVQSISPLLSDVYKVKLEEKEEVRGEIKNTLKKISVLKRKVEELKQEVEKQKKISRLLQRIDEVANAGLILHGPLKDEVIRILRVVNKLSIETLDEQIRTITAKAAKRFSVVG